MPKRASSTAKDFKLVTPTDDEAPDQPASAGTQVDDDATAKKAAKADQAEADPARQHRGHARSPLRLPGAQRQQEPRRTRPVSSTRCWPRRCPATEVQGLPLGSARVRPEDDGAAHAARRARKVVGGHRARPDRQDRPSSRRTSTSRSAPPAAAPRRSTPSRSSTAGSCSRRRRSTAPPARTRSTARPRRPGPADVEGRSSIAACSPTRASRPTRAAVRHPHRPDRPPRAGDARVPGRARLRPHDHLAEVRPLDLHRVRQRQPATRPATRSTSPRSTASR